jgi:hypothetical protein
MRLLAEDIATTSVRDLIRTEVWAILRQIGVVDRTLPEFAREAARKPPLRLVKSDEPGPDQQSQPAGPEERR